MAQQTIIEEGAFTLPASTKINSNFTELYSGSQSGAVTLTGTQTLTNKTLTSPVLTTPAIGAATGTSIVLSGDCKAATYHVGATAGVSAGPFTTVSSITVVNGIVTALTGS